MSGVLRRFNQAGIDEFVRRIDVLRAGGSASIDDVFVNDDAMATPIIPQVRLERPSFTTKHEAGEYLSERTRQAREKHGDEDPGLWTWLSAWHWDAVCPKSTTGGKKVLNPFNYVYGYGHKQNAKKHLIAVAVKLWEVAPTSQLLMTTPVSSLQSVVREVATRLSLMRIKAFPELLDHLYWDSARRRPRIGIVSPTSPRPGDLSHRLPTRIRQLEMTYDLVDLTADQLLNLLGDEFKQWAEGKKPAKVEKD